MLYRKNNSYDIHNTCSTQEIIPENNHENSTPANAKINDNKATRQCWTPFLGVIYAFLASLFFLLSSVLVKKLTYIDSGQLSLVRNLGVLLGNIPIAIYCTRDILGPRKFFWLLIVRSFLGSSALYLNLLSYRLLPLTETSIILSTVPVLVTVVARVHLKEPCGCAQVGAIILTVLGVLMSVRLPSVLQSRSAIHFDRDYIIGLTCACGCVLILTFTMVSLRKMADIHFSTVLLYFGFLGSLENAIITYFTAEFTWPRCGWTDKTEVMLVGVFGFLGHCLIVMAVQKEAAGVVSTSKAASDIIVSAIFQFVFFNSVPDYYTFGGGFLVMIAISLLGMWKLLLSQPEDSAYKKRFKCLLI